MNDPDFDNFLRTHSRHLPESDTQAEAAFRRGVWQRIGENASTTNWWERLIGTLVQPMRPLAGVACLVAMLLAGVALGSLSAGPSGRSVEAKASYLASITPASHAH